MKYKLGFTLAEVLITITIVGVIAVMILPSLIQNYQKKITAGKLKKVYTELTQAMKMSELENGEYKTWETYPDIDGVSYMEKYWKPYLKYIKVCKTYQDCKYSNNYPWKYMSGLVYGTNFVNNEPLILSNGVLVWFQTKWGDTKLSDIFVDLNAGSPPNILGKDVFIFTRKSNGMVVPRNDIYSDQSSINCSKDSPDYTQGLYCAYKIMKDGWEIMDDYPWR